MTPSHDLRRAGFTSPATGKAVTRPAAAAGAPDIADPGATLREVVFASDLSNECALALSHARLLAERFSAHLSLYHVLQAPPASATRDASDELWRRHEAAAQRHLSAHAHGVGVTWDAVVERAPSVAPALLARLQRTRPDVVVMTTRRRTSLAHLMLGSVTETVLEHGDRPLLCVREPDHGVALPYRRVLVPTDLTDASRRAFPLAALLARAFGAQVIALHVVAYPKAAALADVARLVDAAMPKERDVRLFLEPHFANLRVTALVESGEAGEGILRAARLHRPDAIIMATRRRDSLMDRIVGTHAERVLRDSPCPVLVV